MKKMYLQRLFTFLMLTIVLVTNAQIIVDNNIGTNANYADLQEAINAAADNSTIYLHPSATSYGNIKIEKPITIIGRSHSELSNKTIIGNIEITHNGSGTSLKGIEAYFIYLNGLDGTYSGSGTITSPVLVNNIIIEQSKFYLLSLNSLAYYQSTGGVISGAGSNNVLIRGNYFDIIQYGSTTNLNVSQNIITSSISVSRPESTVLTNNIHFTDDINNGGSSIGKVLIQNSIFLYNNGNPEELEINNSQLDNCLTYNYGAGSYNISSGAVNAQMVANNMLFNTDPKFEVIDTNSSELFNIDNVYSLATGSLAIGAGLNNEDIGVFGNGYKFNNKGNPSGYPTIDIISSTAAIPENGKLSITISAKAQ